LAGVVDEPSGDGDQPVSWGGDHGFAIMDVTEWVEPELSREAASDDVCTWSRWPISAHPLPFTGA
jgi:hypothetical protein